MTKRIFIARFARSHDLVDAVHFSRERGWKVVEAFTPCPVHGLDEALGYRPSRLPLACFLFGLFGAWFMMWFQNWTSAVDWRLNIGGRPWNSSLSFACVAFEVMVLAAGVGTVATLLLISRLRPGAKPALAIEQVNDDHFALVLEETIEPLSSELLQRELAGFRPEIVEERMVEGAV